MTFDDLWWCSLTQHCIIWRIESTWVTSLRLEDHISMVSLCDLPLTSCLVVYQNIAVPFFGWWHLPCRSFFEVVPYLRSPYPLMQLPHRRTKISCVFTWCLPLVRENWQDTQRPAVDGPLHIANGQVARNPPSGNWPCTLGSCCRTDSSHLGSGSVCCGPK